MTDQQTLIEQLSSLEPQIAAACKAAAIMGTTDDYATLTMTGLIGSSVADSIPGGSNPLAQGIAAGVSVHEGRKIAAENKGLTVQILVAVTEATIALFGYNHKTIAKKLYEYDRENCEITIKKFGLSKHLTLKDDNYEIHLTGSTAAWSSESDGDKKVFKELA